MMRFFNLRFREKDQPSKTETHSGHLAFVLLAEAHCPDAEAVVRSFKEIEPDRYRITGFTEDTNPSNPSKILTFQFDTNETAFVALMPMPVPNREADEAVKFSVSSFGNGWKLPKHTAHLMVTLPSSGSSLSSIDQLSRFTSLIAAVAKASGAVGVYWGRAGATHDSKFFVDIASNRDLIPRIMLWTGISVVREKGGRLSMLSLGMEQLELPDLLLLVANPTENNALEIFFDLLAYVVDRGAPLPEGNTVGRSAEEKLPVHYVPSPIDKQKEVWRIEWP